MSKIRFTGKTKTEFFATVRKRVDSYFKENNISKQANTTMYFKTIFFAGGLFLLYGLILSGMFSLGVMLAMSILLGMFAAFIGFNICHDAIHGSYSTNPTVNKVLGYMFNLLGANADVWNITHNVVHHTYTNIPGHDEDLEIAPGLVRIQEEDEIKPIQRWQHIYAFPLYSLASLSWVFRKDYVKFFKKSFGGVEVAKPSKRKVFDLFFWKAVYYTLFIIVPLVVLDIAWWQFLIGFLAMHFAEGLVLGLVFQLAHVVEDTAFPEPDDKNNIEEVWAVHQMQTTANFARKNPVVTFFCGGLNMQVEHHLFPKICHIHYPKLAEIVKQTAEECGVPYIENNSFIGAMKSHYKILKKFAMEARQPAKKEKNPVSRAA